MNILKTNELTIAPPDQTDQYYKQIIQDRPLRYDYTGTAKGKAIFLTKAVKEGDVVFKETPFVALQHVANQDYIQACEFCKKIVGTATEQLDHLLSVDEDYDQSAQHGACPLATVEAHSQFPSVIECPECDHVYCSEECQTQAAEQYHQLLCTRAKLYSDSDVLDLSPMYRFQAHAKETNEIFLLVAQLSAFIIQRYSKCQNFAQARVVFDTFCKVSWFDVVATTADLEKGQTMEEYLAVFQELLRDSVELYQNALRENLALLGFSEDFLEEVNSASDFEFFAKCVGMFEVNNIGVDIGHSIGAFCEQLELLPLDGDAPRQDMINELIPYIENLKILYEREDEDDDEEEEEQTQVEEKPTSPGVSFDASVFPSLDGTALFQLVCTMNHSCAPNVAIYYLDGTSQASVIALRDIEEGEELTIAYIDTDQDIQDRQYDLSEYQFVCECQRCSEDCLTGNDAVDTCLD